MKLIGRTGRVAGHDMVVSGAMRIGAAEDNDFRIGISGVSRHHARIVKEGDSYFLEDAGSTNGTFLNGQRVSARERLRHLDVITLGRNVDLITVATDPSTPPPTLTKAIEDAWLEPIEAQAGGPRVDIPPGEITIGRVAPSNVLLDSPLVSQLHARIERTNDHVVASDLGSVNGTFVNGDAIREPIELVDGDTLVIAGTRHFRVHIAGSPGKRARAQEVVAAQTAIFDSGWKTRLVWSADELAELEAERRRILASVRNAAVPADAAAKAAATPPKVAAKPAAPPAPAVAPPPPPVAAAPAAAKPPAAVETKPAVSAPPEVPKPVPPTPTPPMMAPPKPAPPLVPSADAVTVISAPGFTAVKLSGPKGTFQLPVGRHVVGRAEGVGVPILDPQVSRAHAAIIVGASDVRVDDTGSANGTSVNGVKVGAGGVSLKNGDIIAFGKVEFNVELMS